MEHIYVPGKGKGERGGFDDPLDQIALLQGHTAVIQTAERLCLPKDIAAIAFPPSTSVSLQGLLTTNPGHVDPGYNGFLHLTVINMGRLAFPLKRGDRILRVLLFELRGKVERDFPSAVEPVVTNALLDQLSLDFLDISDRAISAAKKEVEAANLAGQVRTGRYTLFGSLAATAVALITGGLLMYGNLQTKDVDLRKEISKEISDLRSQLSLLQGQTSVQQSISTLSDGITKLKSSTKTLP